MTYNNNTQDKKPPTKKKESAIICGFGHIGQSVFDLLSKFDFKIYVISNSHVEQEYYTQRNLDVTFIHGDARNDDILKKAHIHEAIAIFALTDNDLVNISIAIDAKKLNSHIYISVRMFDSELGESLKKTLGIHQVYSATQLAAPHFIPNTGNLKRIGDLNTLHTDYELLLQNNFELNETSNQSQIKISIEQGSLLFKEKFKLKKNKSLFHLIHFFHHSTTFSFKMLTLFFIMILSLSTLIISTHMKLSPLDALYFTVTTITTVGYGDHNFSNASVFMKLYGIVLMFFGTALLASIFSLITDFILAEKLKTFFGNHSIPQKNHHILIGAGNIGARIAEILIKTQEPTVIIESEKTGKFSEDFRRQLAVVEGNPKNKETLIQANILQAKSVICVTDNDVDNLSINQKAKDLNKDIITEMSIFDKEMAKKLKINLKEESIISSPLIAANYFLSSFFFQGVIFCSSFSNSLIVICDRKDFFQKLPIPEKYKTQITDFNLKEKELCLIEIIFSKEK
ncbi:MAG: NAD-binding protein [Bdellovibrionaceae bacterium]|nr:NAD-binding protein [Pseudobdellovibrionaceae bacterium]NUM57889.1 NAD-binding protein [Pseudobdellovibrionaceae bacterium]